MKRIQASEFQKDLLNETIRVLQIDYTMAYQCELQKETKWVRYGQEEVLICLLVLFIINLKRRQ